MSSLNLAIQPRCMARFTTVYLGRRFSDSVSVDSKTGTGLKRDAVKPADPPTGIISCPMTAKNVVIHDNLNQSPLVIKCKTGFQYFDSPDSFDLFTSQSPVCSADGTWSPPLKDCDVKTIPFSNRESGCINAEYVGQFNGDRERHGKGTLTCGDGDIYVGHWANDKFNGQGTFTWKTTGEKYVGNYVNGLMNGQGTKTWPDGKKHVGNFVNGSINGQGTCTWPDGRKYVGNFVNNVINGQGTYTWPDGLKYVGNFVNSKRNGYGTQTHADGRKEKVGYWANDKFMG
eukprot:723377_1